MRMKLIFSLTSIAVVLLVSSSISMLEYSRMSNYVTELIGADIAMLNASQEIADEVDEFHHKVLSVIGDTSAVDIPDVREAGFYAACDSLRATFSSPEMTEIADSAVVFCRDYMRTAGQLQDVVLSDFINTRQWYFENLQPDYNRLRSCLYELNSAIYMGLQKNSATFERGFYRSTIPGTVAVAVGLLMIVLLLFFLMAYYVRPIYRMLSGLSNYRTVGSRYSCTFDGDDELSELNAGITELAGENMQLRKRLKAMKEAAAKNNAGLEDPR